MNSVDTKSTVLITFSLIMLDSPRLLLSLCTWCWMGRGDHPKSFLLKALCCQISPSRLKVLGWWPWALYCHLLGLPFPFPSSQSQFQLHDKSMICYLHTCYDDNCTGTWNIHAISLRNKLRTVPCVIIIQSHSYLFIKVYMQIYISRPRTGISFSLFQQFICTFALTCGQGREASQPKLSRKQLSIMSLPSIQETDLLKNSSFSASVIVILIVLFGSCLLVKDFLNYRLSNFQAQDQSQKSKLTLWSQGLTKPTPHTPHGRMHIFTFLSP